MASINSWVLIAFSALLRLSASNSSRLLPCSASCSANFSSSWSTPWMALCRVSSIWACTTFSGSGTSTCSSSCSMALSRICSACCTRLTWATFSRRSSRSSSMVSNSLASWAKSSSSSGSSRVLTDLTVTVTWASWPAWPPATSVVVKTRLSPSLRPTIASSRPSMSWPEPTSWDNPSVLASGTSSPLTVADRSIETKSPVSAARSTPVRVPKRFCSDSSSALTSSSSISMASTVRVSAEKSGRSISGRMSTSAVNTSSSLSSSLVISISGCPRGCSDSAVMASL